MDFKYLDNGNKSKPRYDNLITIIVVCLILYMLKILGIDNYTGIMTILFIITTGVPIIKALQEKGIERTEIIFILIAWAIRIIVLLVDLYCKDYVTVLHSSSDCQNFYEVSESYYYGDFSKEWSYYPYFLWIIYQFVGFNRMVAQYMNILFWVFNVLIMQKCCEFFELEKKERLLAIMLLCFLPNYIIVTSLLLRESMISFFIFASFYMMLRWMRDKKIINFFFAVLALLPGVILHSGTIAILVVYMIIFAIYDVNKQKIHITKKALLIPIVILFLGVMLWFTPVLKRIFLFYFTMSEDNLIDMVNQQIVKRAKEAGGSTYLVDFRISSYFELMYRTVQRMYCFWLSPMPAYWRGIGDIGAFLMSSSFYLVGFIYGIYGWIKKKNDFCRLLMILMIFFMTLMFAWGVSNAGTAMRHRDKMLPIVIFLFVYSRKLINNHNVKQRVNS